MRIGTTLAALLNAVVLMVMAGASGASAAGVGQPEEWQFGFQGAVTPIMERVTGFHNFLLWIITGVVALVTVLLLIVMVRFNRRSNPTPSKTTHNTLVEVVWTVVPVLILLAIAIPSFRLLYFERVVPEAEMTVKATGNQWYWSYEYPDQEDLSFDAILLEGDALQERRKIDPGAPRLLATDNPIVVPVDTTVRLIVTASDVIHSWAIPSFGIKIDAIPGRLNEAWFRADKTGTYYGQCSELCGQGHAYMPIDVRVVSREDFDAWQQQAESEGVEEANKMLFSRLNDENGNQVAAAE